VAALIAFFQNPGNSSMERAAAAKSLGKMGDARAVDPLIASLMEDNVAITDAVSSALGMLKSKRAIEPLQKAYARWSTGQHESARPVKGSIALALLQLGVKEFMPKTTGPAAK
jgi:HEAT repeat protein